MDDLARIEAIYGSVAEYNRVMEEENEGAGYEPSEEEQFAFAADREVYNEKIRILDGKPSELAVSLKEEWDAKKPAETKDWNMSEVRKWQAYSKERLFAVTKALCTHYGIVHNEEMSLYKTREGSFAIGLEYADSPYIKSWDVSGLSYEAFKNIFRDFHYLGLSPIMNYCDGSGKNHIISNSSLGRLRIHDLIWYGFETEESLENEYRKAGFDETAIRESVLKVS